MRRRATVVPMPELPEVETVRRGLVARIEGKRIVQAEVRRPKLRFPLPERMAERLTGQTVRQIRRRAKYLLFDLDGDETLISHLGMSGRMHIHDAIPNEVQKHDHVMLVFDDGVTVVYNDARRFGMFDLCPTAGIDDYRLLNDLGPEPLSDGFDEQTLQLGLAGRKTPVKVKLLDQKLVVGLGNIYVCEALYRARIDPARSADTLKPREIRTLLPHIKQVLQDAIAAGGSSLRDYVQTDGELGYFQHKFDVYGREGEPCRTPRCKGVIDRITQGGRSTFFCGKCQK